MATIIGKNPLPNITYQDLDKLYSKEQFSQYNKQYPFHFYAYHSNLENIKKIAKTHFDKCGDIIDPRTGLTPLSIAIIKNQPQIIAFLQLNGAHWKEAVEKAERLKPESIANLGYTSLCTGVDHSKLDLLGKTIVCQYREEGKDPVPLTAEEFYSKTGKFYANQIVNRANFPLPHYKDTKRHAKESLEKVRKQLNHYMKSLSAPASLSLYYNPKTPAVGFGICAEREYEPGDLISIYGGELLPGNLDSRSNYALGSVGIENYSIDGKSYCNLVDLAQCGFPDASLVQVDYFDVTYPILVATKKIPKGKQIFWDYRTTHILNGMETYCELNQKNLENYLNQGSAKELNTLIETQINNQFLWASSYFHSFESLQTINQSGYILNKPTAWLWLFLQSRLGACPIFSEICDGLHDKKLKKAFSANSLIFLFRESLKNLVEFDKYLTQIFSVKEGPLPQDLEGKIRELIYSFKDYPALFFANFISQTTTLITKWLKNAPENPGNFLKKVESLIKASYVVYLLIINESDKEDIELRDTDIEKLEAYFNYLENKEEFVPSFVYTDPYLKGPNTQKVIASIYQKFLEKNQNINKN